jgi:hypothetical protein
MDKPRGYKRTIRYTKRLEATFSSGALSYRGILSNISDTGIFIRTNRGFAPGSVVDVEILFPDNSVSKLKGIVRRSIKTPITTAKNGMGIELTEKDDRFLRFVSSVIEQREYHVDSQSAPEFQIISCPGCGAKNKILPEKLSLSPKCGKCGTPLPASAH